MREFDAVIFDLDGVITKTALVHGIAWKRTFDDYLKSRETRFGEKFREFTHSGDYLPFVDGKPRYKGVSSFLESRNITIPFGDPSDGEDKETVCGLGNMKNMMFNRVLDEKGVEVYPSTLKLMKELRKEGVRLGVASSSKNCKPVLERAGLLGFFETRIDGVVSAEIGLKGKPEADIFITACDRLGVEYSRSVVVEDAVSGVMAGRNGNFGLVLGIARENNINELKINGADIVVEDLSEISIDDIRHWFRQGLNEDGWTLTYYDYNKASERSREALLAVGNGYFGTRGALEESRANKVNYPGTYISGLYNRLISRVGDREIENEDLVNIPNYLPVKFRIGDGEWFEFGPEPSFSILRIERKLDFRKGELKREMLIEDKLGNRTLLSSSRFAGMHYHHLACIKYCIKALNYNDTITIRSEIDGNHINAGVERYSSLNQNHINHVAERSCGNTFSIDVKTTHSNIGISLGARHILNGHTELDDIIDCSCSKGKACQDFTLTAEEGKEIVFEKIVAIYSSLDRRVTTPSRHVGKALGKTSNYDGELALSEKAWKKIWEKTDVRVTGDRLAQKLIRLHIYHMIVTASPHNVNIDSGIPPRGLHGEAYRGHIFWDELFILPMYNISMPEVSRSILMYRYRRLDKARDYARKYGYRGAMFPWQSGSDGREETQVLHLNPVSGEWGPDYSSLQRHVSLAVAYNVWNYYQVTGDIAFMLSNGAEIMFEVARFWTSKCDYDKVSDRYSVKGVMGPDEFHEKMPGADEGGLKNNAYTNIMLAWLFAKCRSLLEKLGNDKANQLLVRLGFENDEIDKWDHISKRLKINIDENGIVEQFEGYFSLEELDWDYYSKKYGNIHRLDRILKAEGKSPDNYRLSKQADLLMAFFNLGEKQVTLILRKMGYRLPDDYFMKNYNFYISRTSHGSTLSRLVHSRLAYLHGRKEEGWRMYLEALKSDLEDIQGGTTGEGIHCGVMAGTVCSAMSLFGGLRIDKNGAHINPSLPPGWSSISYSFIYRRVVFIVTARPEVIEITCDNNTGKEIKLHICGEKYLVKGREQIIYKY